MAPGSALLKEGPARTVALEPDGGAGGRVVKRFRHPHPIYRLWDARRARREHAVLATLHAAGAAVPRPLALAREGRGWRVEIEWIPDACSLASILSGAAPWPAPPEVLARNLGRLLAELHALGLDHPDLHPGNVLVGKGGRVLAIDFHKARLVRELGSRTLRRDLARLASGTRERMAPRLRARALLAWLAALPPRLRARLPCAASLAREADRRGRRHRRRAVRERRRRWMRESGDCRVLRRGAGLDHLRRDVAPDVPERLEAYLAERPVAARRLVEGLPGLGSVLVLRGRKRELRERWLAAARGAEHALPLARPLCLRWSRPAWLALELPAGARPLASLSDPRQPSPEALERVRRAAAVARAAFEDRGLDPGRLPPESLFSAESGEEATLWVAARRLKMRSPGPRLGQPGALPE